MTIETPINGIWSLDKNQPPSGDSRREGDDHLRLIKDAILKTFSAVNDVVDCTDEELNILAGALITTAELNYLQGVTSNLQTQIDDPTIMHTDTNNTTTGFFEVDNNLIDINRDISVTLKTYLRLRGDLEVAKWQFIVYGIPDTTRPEAFALMNELSIPKFILRTDSKLLEATDTDLEWDGDALALQSVVTALDTATAKNTDFIANNFNFGTWVGGTPTAQVIDTGFGTTGIEWGVTRIQATGNDYSNHTIWLEDADGRGMIVYDGNGVPPAFSAAGLSAGQVRCNVTGPANTGTDFIVNFWARRRI